MEYKWKSDKDKMNRFLSSPSITEQVSKAYLEPR